MKLQILKKWVRALRSGRYKQGTGQLKIINGIPRYCCLGVLCDLHSKETGTKWTGKTYLRNSVVLPHRVMKWAGLSENDPNLKTNSRVSMASELNDADQSFKFIAGLIEKAQKKKLI